MFEKKVIANLMKQIKINKFLQILKIKIQPLFTAHFSYIKLNKLRIVYELHVI